MELAITLLIVALAAALVLRRVWRLVTAKAGPGCASGCGSCPSNQAANPVVPLTLITQPQKDAASKERHP